MMGRRPLALIMLFGLALTGLAVAAPAASAASTTCLVVDRTSHHRYTSLQAAVNAAAADDTLLVKRTCTGGTAISKNLTIDGRRATGKKVAAGLNGGGQGSVLTIDGGVSVTLNTLTITNGGSFSDGGGIENVGGTVTLNGSTVTGNTALNTGGGIGNFGGRVTLNDSTVTGNTAQNNMGGGIINSDFGTVTLNGTSTVNGNTAGTAGGGIFNFCGSTLVGAVSGGNVFGNNPDNIVNPGC